MPGPSSVTVTVPARLHFGFLDLNGNGRWDEGDYRFGVINGCPEHLGTESASPQ